MRLRVWKDVIRVKAYYDVTDIIRILGISRSAAYALIRKLNEELRKANYLTFRGKVSSEYLRKRIYCGEVPKEQI